MLDSIAAQLAETTFAHTSNTARQENRGLAAMPTDLRVLAEGEISPETKIRGRKRQKQADGIVMNDKARQSAHS